MLNWAIIKLRCMRQLFLFSSLLKKSIEAETVKTSEVFKKTFDSLSDTVREVRNQHFLLFTSYKDLLLRVTKTMNCTCICPCGCIVGAWGGQSYWFWKEDQRRCRGGSKDSDALCRISLQRRRKIWQNQRVQGNFAGLDRTQLHLFCLRDLVWVYKTVHHLCRAWRPWRRRSTWVTPAPTELPLSWGNEVTSPPKAPTAAPECSRPMSEWSLELKSALLCLAFVDVVSLSITDITVMVAVLQRGNGSRSPQGFKVVPAVEGLQGQ